MKRKLLAVITTIVISFFLLAFNISRMNNDLNSIQLKKPQSETTVFKDIRVFDGEKLINPCTVIIKDSKIIEVGQNIKIPRNATIYQGDEHTLMPGLIDAHVHIVSLRDLKQEAVFGVTTVLDMMTTVEFMQQARARVKSDCNTDMADFFSSGQPATYPGGHGTEWGTEIPTISRIEDVNPFMDSSISAGVDYIKIMSGLGKKVISKDIVATVANEAGKRGLLTVVHIETYSKAFEAISAGVNGLGHCFADTLPDDILINLMKEKKVFVIPTLSVMNSLPDAKKIVILKDQRLSNLIVPEILVGLKNDRPYRGYKQLKYKNAEESVRILHNAGIPILAGTDSYNPGTVHGASMHGELELLTYAGLSPLDALISATSLTAKTFGLKDRGRIAKGMRADLLLVKGDPTKNITDTRNIEDVWINGKKVDRVPWINKIEKQQKEWNETGEVPGPIGSEPGLICNFESGDLITEFGIFFFAISDKFFGGSSQSLIKYSNQGANNSSGSLMISGKVDCSKPKAWSGAAFFPSAMEFTIANLSGWNAVSFDAKGDTDSIMVMFMLSDQRFPVSKNFKLTNEWKKFTIPFNELGSESGKNIVGMIFGSNSCSNEFTIRIDNLKLTNLILTEKLDSSKTGTDIKLANQYLGQTPPDVDPKVFAPGIVSTPEFLEIGCTWSPDGKEFYFVRQTQTGGLMLCSRWENGKWTDPEVPEVFKKHPGFEPFISADGKKFFYTRFALPPEMAKNPEKYTDQQKQESMANIWVMNKNGLDFGDPEFCAPGMFSSTSKNGNLYTTIITGEKPGIYRYNYENEKYSEKEFLGGGVNSPVMGAHPCIAPDESFIVFDSKRKDDPEDTDLYVCFKLENGGWSEAYWLGDKVNTKWNDICPSLSPDGKYLFYMSKADIYWVSTEVLNELRNNENSNQSATINNYKIVSNSNSIIIPFEYYRNKFRFKAKINGKNCNMMLDNGSLWDELLFFGSPDVDSLDLKFTGETSIGFSKADIAENVTIEFKDIVFNNQTAIVTRYDPKFPNPWEGTEGQVSAAFFKNFIVKIDFKKRLLELIPPEKFNYSGNGLVLEMKHGPFNSRLVSATVDLDNGNSVQLDLLVDLGGLYPVYLPLGRDEKITKPEKAKEFTLGAGLQVQKGYLGNIKSIHLGEISLNNIEAAFIPVTEEANVYGNTMIGLPLLQKFTVIFDYFNNRLILETSNKH